MAKYLKRTVDSGPSEVYSRDGMQRWFYIRKSINVIYHLIKQREKSSPEIHLTKFIIETLMQKNLASTTLNK
jgi:hypothetical protein